MILWYSYQHIGGSDPTIRQRSARGTSTGQFISLILIQTDRGESNAIIGIPTFVDCWNYIVRVAHRPDADERRTGRSRGLGPPQIHGIGCERLVARW